jgi:GH25 family lysozyme M1 (1,4-beta-N-acetylmuramidase)
MATISQSSQICGMPSSNRHLLAYFKGFYQRSAIVSGFILQSIWILVLLLMAAPAAWAGRPIGTDVSGFQPNINWTNVKSGGVSFAWAKATEGTGYTSPDFTTQESYAKQVGIYIGAYHFARPSSNPNLTGANSADSEAQYFWGVAQNYVKYGGAYLVPMLDWEDPYATNGNNSFNGYTTSYMSQWVNEWCNSVSNSAAAAGIVGLRPVVYTGTWYSTAHSGAGQFPGLDSTVTSLPDWIATYNGQPWQSGAPASTTPWPSWNLWQYSDTNWSGGDADVYNGNLAGFIQQFVIGGTNAPFLTTNPTNISVGLGSNATFAVRASGLAPLTFQWYAGGKLIPGATSSNYVIATATWTNAVGYYVTVSNSYAAIASSTVYLSVIGPRTNAPASVVAPANLVSWWPGEANGLDIYGGNNATPNGAWYYTNGECGFGFHFDGVSTYLTPATNTTLAPNWTLCLWVNRQNAPATSAAIMGDTTYAVKLEQFNAARKIGLTHSGVADYYFNCVLPQNAWTHLAIVNSGSAIQVYSNGVFVTSQLFSNSVVVTPPSFPLPRACIGGDLLANGNLTDPMLGRLDEIQIFSRALSAAEISTIYGAGSAGLVRAPEFTGVISTNSGQIQLQLRGLTGKNYTIYSSPDLMAWTTLGIQANPAGTNYYNTSTTANSQLFYRAEQ